MMRKKMKHMTLGILISSEYILKGVRHGDITSLWFLPKLVYPVRTAGVDVRMVELHLTRISCTVHIGCGYMFFLMF